MPSRNQEYYFLLGIEQFEQIIYLLIEIGTESLSVAHLLLGLLPIVNTNSPPFNISSTGINMLFHEFPLSFTDCIYEFSAE